MLPSFTPVSPVSDPVVQKLQQAVQRALRRVTACPLLDGNLVTVTFAAGAPTAVAHKLGRPALGYLVAGLTAAARLTRTTTATEAQLLTLTSDAATTATLWIF